MINQQTQPVALVTGGTRGIGRGVAEALAGEGFTLALCGMRPAEQVEETLAGLPQPDETLYVQADISDTRDRSHLLQAVRERFGRLDVLVNNAGVAPRERLDILETTEESYARVMDTNLKGPFFLTQAAATWMIEQQQEDPDTSRCVINVGSVSATLASPNRGEYCLSKAGIAMHSQLWAVRLAAFDIPVYEIRPGITATDMTAGVKEKYDQLIEEGLVPQARWGSPEDVGRAAAALARGDFPYSTGQVIMVDGGMTLGRL